MRIGIIGSRGYPSTYGGFETLVRVLAPYLRDRGHAVTVYGRDHPSQSIVYRDGIRCINTRGLESKSLSTLSFGLTSILDARQRRFDVVVVLNCAHGFFLPLLRRSGIPTLVNVDGEEWRRGKWGRFGRAAFRTAASLTAKYADVIVADSRVIAQIWHKEFGRDSVFIPYGGGGRVDPGTGRLAALGLEHDSYLLVVARLVPENNVALFLDAWCSMRPRPPAVVVGQASYRSQLERRARHLAQTYRDFHWFGHVDDQELLNELWANCAVYFHGHSVGGTNPALVQAMALGAPVLAIDTAFNREVLANDNQLVEPNVAVIAHQMSTLLNDAASREVLRERGRARVSTHYTWQTVCEQYEKNAAALRR
jgi:glycosyltransferase involved in cell wall biosynthesis